MSIVNNLYYPAFIGECSKHKGHGWLGCPLCAIEYVESRRKELSEMLNPNDFDIDSFLDYKPNFKTMQKKIPFDPSLIGKPGIEVRVDGEVPKYIEYFPDRKSEYTVAFIDHDGDAGNYMPTYPKFKMYRNQRSAEDIAKEVYNKMIPDGTWEKHPSINLYTALVQSGMDEMKGGEE